jgi:hypothetical protein
VSVLEAIDTAIGAVAMFAAAMWVAWGGDP